MPWNQVCKYAHELGSPVFGLRSGLVAYNYSKDRRCERKEPHTRAAGGDRTTGAIQGRGWADAHPRAAIQESVWLALNQIADLFQRDKSVISKHIKNIFDTGELDPARTVAKFATVQTEGVRSVTREIEFLSSGGDPGRWLPREVGARHAVPPMGNRQLEGYLVKGFAMDVPPMLPYGAHVIPLS